MAHWLFKSEPSAYSWSQMVKDKRTGWTGVRNWQAANNMKAMQLGDTGFFYHSNEERQIVGIVRVAGLYHPDPTDESGRFGMVDLEAVKPVPKPVTLAEIKAEPRLSQLPLVRQSRLSVSPVDDEAWKILCRMAGVAP